MYILKMGNCQELRSELAGQLYQIVVKETPYLHHSLLFITLITIFDYLHLKVFSQIDILL